MRSMSYKGANTNSSISPAIWGDLPIEDWALGYGGTFVFDDFNNFGGLLAATGACVDNGPYAGFTTTSGASLVQPSATSTDLNGVVKMTPGASSGKEAYLQSNMGIGFEVLTPTTLNVGTTFAFECRVAVSVIASTNTGLFFGLGDPGVGIVTGGLVTTTGLPKAANNFIGFNVRMDAVAAVDCIVQAGSQTIQLVNAAAIALVANTYVKLGFRYQSSGSGYTPARSLKFFVNGVEQATAVTSTNIAAATFPSAVTMSRLAMVKNGAGATGVGLMDWWGLGVSRA